MITLENILEMWKEDCKIDNTSLDEVSRKTPNLHAKYLEIRAAAKLKLQQEEMKQKTLLRDKWLYYNGKMSKEKIEKLGWKFDPFDGLRVLKGEMDYYYNADIDIQESEKKIEYWKNVLTTIEEIINNLNWRHQTINNMIKWRMFEAGA